MTATTASAPSWFIMEQNYDNAAAPHRVHDAFHSEEAARAALAGPEYKGTFAYVISWEADEKRRRASIR